MMSCVYLGRAIEIIGTQNADGSVIGAAHFSLGWQGLDLLRQPTIRAGSVHRRAGRGHDKSAGQTPTSRTGQLTPIISSKKYLTLL